MSWSILVVDDDRVFRGLARLVLVDLGFVVVGEAATAAAAIVAAHELKPDAVLVDVGLPDGDGLKLASELVALSWQPRVVLTSADPHITRAEDVRQSGAGAFVPKDELANASLPQLLALG
jgi:two-component system nitrate/nitrite response regulator NarL